MLRSHLHLALACAVLFGAGATAGCGNDSSSTTTSPTSPTTSTTSFEGSFVQAGSVAHTFAVATTGTVTIKLTSVNPLTTMALGVSLTTSDGTTCGTVIAQNTNGRAGTTALSGTATNGNYCVKVYDSGNVPADWTVSYKVDVVHP